VSPPEANWVFGYPLLAEDGSVIEEGNPSAYVVLALDTDGSGLIVPQEVVDYLVSPANPATHRYPIKPVFPADADAAFADLSWYAVGGLWGNLPFAGGNLAAFLAVGSVPDEAAVNPSTISWNGPDLDYSVGVDFDDSCQGALPELVFSPLTRLATEVIESQTMENHLLSVFQEVEDDLLLDMMVQPIGSEFDYSSQHDFEAFTYPDPEQNLNAPDADLYYAFGKVKVDIDIRYS